MKLTIEEMKNIVEEFSDYLEVEKEYRRGSSFYATGSYEFSDENKAKLAELLGRDSSSLIGTSINASGTWDDNWGSEWLDYWQEKKIETIIPEKTIVIPEHVQVTWEKM